MRRSAISELLGAMMVGIGLLFIVIAIDWLAGVSLITAGVSQILTVRDARRQSFWAMLEIVALVVFVASNFA